ncbi:MAG: hypothetical protein V7637_5734 [Mycobacteriales bacterium]|jgi:hypothetical protein
MSHTDSRARTAARQRERSAALRARQQAARRRRLAAVAAATTIVVITAALLVTRMITGGQGTAATTGAEPGVIAEVTHVPATVLDAVGAGQGASGPTPITGAPALTTAGKPRIVYLGAEYCPYCAAERWAVVQALSRFGTFSGLGQTRSAAADVYPNTATLSFHGATYSSAYLVFDGYEQQSNQRAGGSYAPLDPVPADVTQLAGTYGQGGIPFVDLGGAAVINGADYSPSLLAGKSQAQIAAALSDASSPIAKAVLGEANRISATLCTLTGGQPGAVCRSAGVQAAAHARG